MLSSGCGSLLSAVDSGDPKAIFDMPAHEVWPEFIRRNTGIQTRR